MSIQPVQGPAVPASAPRPAPPKPEITPDERQFFAELYPEAAREIQTHRTYGREGAAQQPRLGSMIDRRG